MSQIPLPVVEKPPRPRANSDMVRKAAELVAPKVRHISADEIVRQYRHPMDGYELAKELNHWESCDVSREDMETLDEVEWKVDELLDAAVKEWFETNDIQPPLPIGTRIKEGVITGIYEHGVATYKVKENGCTDDSRYLLIKFEKAVAVEVQP